MHYGATALGLLPGLNGPKTLLIGPGMVFIPHIQYSSYPIFIAITVHWVLLGRRRSSICRNGLNMFFWRRHKRKLPNRYALRGREMISTDHSKVEQPMAKTLARHPLVLLDQQLKNLAKYEVLTKADQPQNNPTQVEMSLPP